MQADLCRFAVMTIQTMPPVRARLRLASDPQAVRDGLRQLLAAAPLCDLSEDVRGSAEIVLAEVLNNIVEHAYPGFAGLIDVTLDYAHPTLSFEVVDTGHAMPCNRLPKGELADLDDTGELPEGGFGWFLIRNLTNGLAYSRVADRNTLAFWMDAQ